LLEALKQDPETMGAFLARNRYQLVFASLALMVLAQPLVLHFNPGMISRRAFLVWLVQVLAGLGMALGAVVAGLWWWLVKSPVVRERCRRWGLTLSLLLVAGLVFSAGSILLKRGLPYGSFLLSFDRDGWCDPKSADWVNGDLTPRQKMLGAVVRTVLKPGGIAATREAIVSHLGPTEKDDQFDPTRGGLSYRLGPQHDSMFAIDDDWLLIWLDDHENFLRFEIRPD
jgi:MFS family permease